MDSGMTGDSTIMGDAAISGGIGMTTGLRMMEVYDRRIGERSPEFDCHPQPKVLTLSDPPFLAFF